ncbi:uncharacterized protein LOC117239833 [Bombus vosnesenskii]|uniref:Uncharacterized protein LOC117239238 n=1 Tax=Bombus vosnesenskii TaxID=207650 RepID=A0A6J3L798_9HYME|nr:uncharacterized protein LOC117239238 [Bombus vosnesenskii]XP_033361493.1 uncharacterized protein LOC117239786 [Bombus vosnesenskii]XP_033361557.1 uncharacterized protein LOC117239833 [Bombus vosnesenskii]
MADETVQVGPQMKYLGLVIDSQWTFEPHFDCLIPKVSVAANALCGLLPYIGGGGDAVRRFSEGVILSRAMYPGMGGRPVGEPPQHPAPEEATRVWHPGEDPTEQAAPNDIGTAEDDTWDRLRSQLIKEGGEYLGAEAVFSNWEAWRSRHGLPLTFRMTQILTGHGMFCEFLKRIGRETTDICHHRGEDRDMAQHTLGFCPAWELPRYSLRHATGGTLTPTPVIIEAMLRGPQT